MTSLFQRGERFETVVFLDLLWNICSPGTTRGTTAELAGKEFDPATRTELEIEQLYALYESEGKPMEEFVREHMMEGYHA